MEVMSVSNRIRKLLIRWFVSITFSAHHFLFYILFIWINDKIFWVKCLYLFPSNCIIGSRFWFRTLNATIIRTTIVIITSCFLKLLNLKIHNKNAGWNASISSAVVSYCFRHFYWDFQNAEWNDSSYSEVSTRCILLPINFDCVSYKDSFRKKFTGSFLANAVGSLKRTREKVLCFISQLDT